MKSPLVDMSLGFRFEELGGHVHVDVFAGKPGMTRGNAGRLVVSVDEWGVMRKWLEKSRTLNVDVEIYEKVKHG